MICIWTNNFDERFSFSGELLLDWFLIHFEGRNENLALIRQILMKCCTCLISLGVLRVENDPNNDLFQVGESFLHFPIQMLVRRVNGSYFFF